MKMSVNRSVVMAAALAWAATTEVAGQSVLRILYRDGGGAERGRIDLLPNKAGQTVDFLLANTGPSIDLFGLTFVVRVGPSDGSIDTPNVVAADLTTGTVFAGVPPPILLPGYTDQIKIYSVSIDGGQTPRLPANSETKLASVTFDTTGFSPADDPWDLFFWASVGTLTQATTYFPNGSGDPIVAAPSDQRLAQIFVPEPRAGFLATGTLLLGWRLAGRKRRTG